MYGNPARSFIFLLFLTLVITSMSGCFLEDLLSGGSGGGVFVHTVQNCAVGSINAICVVSNASVGGELLQADPGASGIVPTYFGFTDEGGVFATSPDIVLPGTWRHHADFPELLCPQQIQTMDTQPLQDIFFTACANISFVTVPSFSFTNSLPTTLTITGSGLKTVGGMPRINLFKEDPTTKKPVLVSKTLATSVSPDGTTAVFPFPKTSNGQALSAGHYNFNVWNQSSAGSFNVIGYGYFSSGTNDTSNVRPWGVAIGDSITQKSDCSQPTCITTTTVTPEPLITLRDSGVLLFKGAAIAVGHQPIATQVYKINITGTSCRRPPCSPISYTFTNPAMALVANYADNSISYVDLARNLSVGTIAVGVQPCAIETDHNGSMPSKAYIANYGSGTVSQIDLNSMNLINTFIVGPAPAALAMDPSNTAIWVGGQNYIKKIDVTSNSVTATYPVSGWVTSLAYSLGQKSVVYTVQDSTAYWAEHMNIASGTKTAFARTNLPASFSSTTNVAASPNPLTMAASGALTSANYSNGIAVVATPTGFAVIDLIKNITILQGNTPSAVRGIATDPKQGIVYLTAPETNSIISVPLPPGQQ